MNLIHIIDDDKENARKGGLRFGAEGGSGLLVEFDTGTATLRNFNAPENEANQDEQSEKSSNPNSFYHSIGPSPNEGKLANDWETSMRIQNFEVYDLGGHATVPFEEQLTEKPRLRTATPDPHRKQVLKKDAAPSAKPSVPKVDGEELRKRIQGFGPSD